jgi:hypothetical protein
MEQQQEHTMPKFTANEISLYSGPFSANAKFKSPEEEWEWASQQSTKCSKCSKKIRLSECGGNTSGRDPFDKKGYRLRRLDCKDCNKKAGKGKTAAVKLAKKLGIPFKAPEGTECGICKSIDKKLVFDHCHTTNKFRDYLCDPCNRSMGVLGDNVDGLLRALNYLNKHEGKNIVVDADGSLKISDTPTSF